MLAIHQHTHINVNLQWESSQGMAEIITVLTWDPPDNP